MKIKVDDTPTFAIISGDRNPSFTNGFALDEAMAERDAALIFALLLTLLTALLTDADIVKVLGDRLIDLSDVGFLDIFDGWTNNRVIEGRENESDNFWTSLQILA